MKFSASAALLTLLATAQAGPVIRIRDDDALEYRSLTDILGTLSNLGANNKDQSPTTSAADPQTGEADVAGKTKVAQGAKGDQQSAGNQADNKGNAVNEAATNNGDAANPATVLQGAADALKQASSALDQAITGLGATGNAADAANPKNATAEAGQAAGDKGNGQAANKGAANDAANKGAANDAANKGAANDAANKGAANDAANKGAANDAANKGAANDAANKGAANDAANKGAANDAANKGAANDAANKGAANDAANNVANSTANAGAAGAAKDQAGNSTAADSAKTATGGAAKAATGGAASAALTKAAGGAFVAKTADGLLLPDGRIGQNIVETDFNVVTSVFKSAVVKGEGLVFSDIVTFPGTTPSIFDVAGNTKAFEISINDSSIFTPQGGQPQAEFRRADLLPSIISTANNSSTTGRRTMHFSIQQDPAKPLALTTNEYQLAFLETADFASRTFDVRVGTGTTGPSLDGSNIVVFGRSGANIQEMFVAPFSQDIQNFAVTLDFDQNTMQVFHSTGATALAQVSQELPNDNSGDGEYHFALLKLADAQGQQAAGINEGIIYSGIVMEDSSDGTVTLQ